MDSLPAHLDRILVLSMGGLGDTIMATPLCKALRQQYPEAEIHAITMWESSAAVLQALNVFDEVHAHNFFKMPFFKSIAFVWDMRRRRLDLSVNVFPSNRGHYNVLAALIAAPFRVGHDYRVGHALPYGRFLLTHRVPQERNVHCVLENLKLARATYTMPLME